MVLPVIVSAEFDLSNIRIGSEGLSEKLFKEEPGITTSLDDAKFGVPYLDEFNPKQFKPLNELERDSEGSYILKPGNYEFESQSYCMQAGTYGPGRGDGYLLAPLKGKQADIVSSILKNSVAHPEIDQKSIQVLIWAVVSRTKINEMDEDMQATAAKLLTPRQIFKLNGGALGLLPTDLKGAVYERLPESARQILQAEAELRANLAGATADYSELESIAVLNRESEDDEAESGPEISVNRWSYHTDGYFIRYIPDTYYDTVIQIHSPEKHTIQRDSQGRIISLADTHGNRIETSYDDLVPSVKIPGDPGVKAYMFDLIKFIHPNPDKEGETLTAEWKDKGWVFVGKVNGKGRFADVTTSRKHSLPLLAFAFTSYRIADSEGEALEKGLETLEGLKDRYDNANKRREQLQDFKDRLEKQNRERSQQDIDDLTDLEHYKDGLDKALSDDMGDKADWVDEHLNVTTNAWNYGSCNLAGGCNADEPDVKPKNPKKLDPSKHAVVPANRKNQRLGMSLREFKK
jgi:hypothetical protein